MDLQGYTHRAFFRCCHLLSFLLIIAVLDAKTADGQSSARSRDYGEDLKDWIQARCGREGVALWVYEGQLVDPLEGRKIANVEGLELVRCLSNVGDSSNPENKRIFGSQCRDLEVGPFVTHPNATFDRASIILTRKLFCYKSPDNPRQLLTSIKLRPNSPTRKVPTKQAVAVYETATTFIATGKDLIAHTEWPDRQSIWGRATRNFLVRNENAPGRKAFDFTIYARQKSKKNQREQMFDLSRKSEEPIEESAGVVSSPKRSKWIEFGTGSSNGKDKFGARETYSYSMLEPQSSGRRIGFLQRLLGHKGDSGNTEIPSCTVRYSRYGEGPPFFGPGRICSLELQGRRVSSLDELPPLTSSLIAERMSPRFLSLYNKQTMSQREAIVSFRNEASDLYVKPADNEPSDFWLPDYVQQRAKVYWDKLKLNFPWQKKEHEDVTNWDTVYLPP